MFEISFFQAFIFITILWIITRIFFWIKNKKSKEKLSAKKMIAREFKLLLVYLCIIVIARIVYFPLHHINGHIGTLKFNRVKIIPLRVNLIPFIHLYDIYAGRYMNIIGNICMFIPVGIVWPVCFKELNKLWKILLAGFGFSLFIEISQLFFYERCTDVDDLLMNTFGVFIGILLYYIFRPSPKQESNN